METVKPHEPWNKGKFVGQKPPLKLKDFWAIHIHFQLHKRISVLTPRLMARRQCEGPRQP